MTFNRVYSPRSAVLSSLLLGRLAIAAAAILLLSPLARAQQRSLPVIGILASDPAAAAPYLAVFRQGLNEAGFIEGRNVAIEFRYAEGHFDRFPALAAELVQRHVAVIGVMNVNALAAAKEATQTIPIVLMSVGVAGSLGDAGGNVTGVTFGRNAIETISQKRLEMVNEIVPDAGLIALLVDPNHPVANSSTAANQKAAQMSNRQLLVLKASSDSEIDAAFQTLSERRAGALIVRSFAFFESRRDRIVALAARQKIPTFYGFRMWAESGGLLSYGPDATDDFRLAGRDYVSRILKGATPAELPLYESTKGELVLNLKTAKALGLTIPQSIQKRAATVIE